jgi:hypothetical protein
MVGRAIPRRYFHIGVICPRVASVLQFTLFFLHNSLISGGLIRLVLGRIAGFWNLRCFWNLIKISGMDK